MRQDHSNTTRELVQAYFGALVQRNLEQILSFFAEDVDWYIPGNEALAPWLGRRSNKQEIADFFTLLWQQAEPVSGEVAHMLVDGDVAIISGSFSSRMLSTGKLFSSLLFLEITVQDGLIVKYRLLEEGYGLSEALKG